MTKEKQEKFLHFYLYGALKAFKEKLTLGETRCLYNILTLGKIKTVSNYLCVEEKTVRDQRRLLLKKLKAQNEEKHGVQQIIYFILYEFLPSVLKESDINLYVNRIKKVEKKKQKPTSKVPNLQGRHI